MTLDCKWSGRRASAKCVQTVPEAHISRIYPLALKLEGNNSWNNPGEQQEDEFPASFPALFALRRGSIIHNRPFNFRFSLTTSFWGIAKRCCALLVVISHPSKGGFEFLLKVHVFRIRIKTWACGLLKRKERGFPKEIVFLTFTSAMKSVLNTHTKHNTVRFDCLFALWIFQFPVLRQPPFEGLPSDVAQL